MGCWSSAIWQQLSGARVDIRNPGHYTAPDGSQLPKGNVQQAVAPQFTFTEWWAIGQGDTLMSRTYTSAHDKPMNLKSVQGSTHTKPGKQSIGLVELAKTMCMKGLDNPHLPIQERSSPEPGLTKQRMTEVLLEYSMGPPMDRSWASPKLPTIGFFYILVLLLVVHCFLSLFYVLVGSTSATLFLVILGLTVAFKQ
ncbi:hypothetical protein EI94DRAFT_1696129 [Lactarius quietus]|nr:hypothetical protein EI94DRAFT_1696129 [Lactarius quietus]